MKTLPRLLLPISATILLAAYVWSQSGSVHDFTGRCKDCHLFMPKEGEKERDFIFTRDMNYLCEQCHGDLTGLSHPVGMRPSMKVPSTYPLDWKGDLTCNTCHVAHWDNAQSKKNLLRTAVIGEFFCSECHLLSVEEGIDLHKAALETAHVTSRYTVNDRANIIDELSWKCLNCHDDSIADDVSFSVVGVGVGDFRHNDDIGLSHPIGVDYFRVSSENPSFVPPDSLIPEIKLFDGKVGCGTCHNPYSKMHFQLVISNEYSALCVACHKK